MYTCIKKEPSRLTFGKWSCGDLNSHERNDLLRLIPKGYDLRIRRSQNTVGVTIADVCIERKFEVSVILIPALLFTIC